MSEHALVIGESLIDVVRRADGDLAEFPGGSPLNVAIGLARLGREAHLATWYGHDAHGTLIEEHLRASGVRVVPGSDAACKTSVAQATLDATGAATYVFDLEWRLDTQPQPDGVLVTHAGSIATTLAPGGSQVLAALRALRPTSTITFDPNMRPDIIGTREETLPQVLDYVRASDVVKVSDEDLAWLLPGEDDVTVAKHWAQLGPALVVVTRGPRGSRAFQSNGAVVEIPAIDIPVADTVGAGDSFMSGLIDSLWSAGLLGAEHRADLHAASAGLVTSALERAARIASVTVSRPGANPPWLWELEEH